MTTEEYSNAEITKTNGQIVVDALCRLGEPSTLKSVVNFIARSQQMDSVDIQEAIKEILDRGVLLGYVRKIGKRYAVEATASAEYSSEAEDSEPMEPGYHGGRRRGRSGSRKRRKSRSKSRRRSKY